MKAYLVAWVRVDRYPPTIKSAGIYSEPTPTAAMNIWRPLVVLEVKARDFGQARETILKRLHASESGRQILNLLDAPMKVA